MATTAKTPKRPTSRPGRWAAAVSDAQSALSEIQSRLPSLSSALEDLRAVQEEYEEWKDNLPENLSQSALAEKLEEVCNLEIGVDSVDDLENTLSELEGTLSEAEAVDLPRGFGRD